LPKVENLSLKLNIPVLPHDHGKKE